MATNTTVSPRPRSVVRLRRKRLAASAPCVRDQRRVAERHSAALDGADDALARDRLEVRHRRAGETPRAAGPSHDGGGQRMLADRFETGGEPQQLVLRSRPAPPTERRQRRLALGERAGLVDDQRVDLLQQLERLGVADQHAGLGAAARADHDGHRRREAERARARDDEHGDGVDERVREARLGPDDAPDATNVTTATPMTMGTNQAETGVGQPLNRRARALRLADHAHDLREERVACRRARVHHEARPCR